MSRYSDLIQGLQLLQSKLPENKQSTSAEHDIIYAAHKDEVVLTDEEEATLKKLGWHLCSEVDCWAFFT